MNTGPILIAVLAGLFLREGFRSRLFAGLCRRLRRASCNGLGTTGSGGHGGLGIALCVASRAPYASAGASCRRPR